MIAKNFNISILFNIKFPCTKLVIDGKEKGCSNKLYIATPWLKSLVFPMQ